MAEGTDTATAASGRRVLIAVDPSEESKYALKWSLENIIKPGDKIHVLHAQPYPKIYAGPAGPGNVILQLQPVRMGIQP